MKKYAETYATSLQDVNHLCEMWIGDLNHYKIETDKENVNVFDQSNGNVMNMLKYNLKNYEGDESRY